MESSIVVGESSWTIRIVAVVHVNVGVTVGVRCSTETVCCRCGSTSTLGNVVQQKGGCSTTRQVDTLEQMKTHHGGYGRCSVCVYVGAVTVMSFIQVGGAPFQSGGDCEDIIITNNSLTKPRRSDPFSRRNGIRRSFVSHLTARDVLRLSDGVRR